MTTESKTEDQKTEKTKAPAASRKKAAATTEEVADTGKQYSFATSKEKTPEIPIERIEFADFDSRATESELDKSFVESIRTNGIIEPVVVSPLDNGNFLLIAGRHRVRAAKELGLKTVPIAPKELKGRPDLTPRDEAELLCLTENLQNTHLTAWDLAVQFRHWKDDKGWSQTKIAKEIGRKDAFVSQYLGIFDLDKRAQKIIQQNSSDSGVISKARVLKGIADPDTQFEVAKACFDKDNPYTTTQLTEVVESIKTKEEAKRKKAEEKAAAEKSGAKKPRAAKGEGGTPPEEPTPEVSSFAEVKVTAKVDEIRALGALVEKRHADAREKFASATVKERAEAEAKLQYQKGQLDMLKMLTGQKVLPKSVVSA